MNKKIIAASLIAASTSMMAMDLQYFLGAGAERGNVNLKASATVGNISGSISEDSSDTALKLKAGVIVNKEHRVYLSNAKFSNNGGDITLTLINYDYLIPVNEKSKLFAGVHLGKAKYNEDDFNMSGSAYGIQTGILYDITKNIEIELGAGYSLYNVDSTFTDGSDTVKVEIEDSTSMSLGINYKF